MRRFPWRRHLRHICTFWAVSNPVYFILSNLVFLCFSGAFGYFEVTHDISKYSMAKVFSQVGKKTPLAIRFSTVGGESGSADTVR